MPRSQIVSINRDPFGRYETTRERIAEHAECAWCGQNAKFRYGYQRDGGGSGFDSKVFCGIDCRRAYYDE